MLCREKVFIYYLCNLKIILSLEIELIKRANMQNAKVYKEMAAELQPRGRKDSKRRPLVQSATRESTRQSRAQRGERTLRPLPFPALCFGEFCAPENCIPTQMTEKKRNQNPGTKLIQVNSPWLSVLWLRKLNTIATTKPLAPPSKNITQHQ